MPDGSLLSNYALSAIATHAPASGFAPAIAPNGTKSQRVRNWEIIGVPEVHEVSSDERHFSPHQRETPQHPYQLSLKGRASTSNDHAERGCVVR